jgi:putative transposase
MSIGLYPLPLGRAISCANKCENSRHFLLKHGEAEPPAPSPRSLGNTVLDVQVAAIHAQSRRSYGRGRIVRQPHAQCLTPRRERVRKSLLRQKLRPVYRRPYRVATDSKHDKPIAANILKRRFEGWRMNRAWTGDITYIPTTEGWLYLAVIMTLPVDESSVGQ